MATEYVYIGSYDNRNDFQLNSDVSGVATAVDLSSVTRIDANINGLDISSTNQASDKIRWDQAGYGTGEIRCTFGDVVGLTEGAAPCYFIVYDPTNSNGIVFGPITLTVLDLP